MNKTGLFFMFTLKNITPEDQSCSGGKHSKERVILLLGANMSGTEN